MNRDKRLRYILTIWTIVNIKVINFLNSVNQFDLYLSVLSIGEIKKGIAKINDLKKQKDLNLWLNDVLLANYRDNLLDINFQVISKWGELVGLYEKKGIILPIIDSLLISTSICYNMIFVTRNVKDIKILECNYLNPWE
ncbi:MAG: hypothetical protein A2086_14685 [Spirochaetes bacterium GWD1_27_9]|nr:MAG: hypothetical protein A2Z98_04715 [Spirochaetes bacterium GWB1_27_13]OHD22679.1 MAG: hypothetical protein A2Y34_04055 [Spirochaetes bacterium GWC1_27_15]OHD38554.1 MAG: hypothetical protein A2086_14685 [Spirochaetes bacterium GWD1_27_9]